MKRPRCALPKKNTIHSPEETLTISSNIMAAPHETVRTHAPEKTREILYDTGQGSKCYLRQTGQNEMRFCVVKLKFMFKRILHLKGKSNYFIQSALIKFYLHVSLKILPDFGFFTSSRSSLRVKEIKMARGFFLNRVVRLKRCMDTV